jgi:hypothetical protein
MAFAPKNSSKNLNKSQVTLQKVKKVSKNNKVAMSKRVTVDIVTGKEVISVYFDPNKSCDCDNNDYDWIGENLYAPSCIVKDDGTFISVRLPSGEVYKMTDATRVTDNDDEGVDDILKLRDFSEMSLIHTLRIRYFRDEIYTFVGPILISLNPYKKIKELYSDTTLVEYHGKKPVRNFLSLIITFRFKINFNNLFEFRVKCLLICLC